MIIRTGAWDPKDAKIVHEDKNYTSDQLKTLAEKRYQAVISTVGHEVLISGSDDFTMFMWKPESEKTSMARLTVISSWSTMSCSLRTVDFWPVQVLTRASVYGV